MSASSWPWKWFKATETSTPEAAVLPMLPCQVCGVPIQAGLPSGAKILCGIHEQWLPRRVRRAINAPVESVEEHEAVHRAYLAELRKLQDRICHAECN